MIYSAKRVPQLLKMICIVVGLAMPLETLLADPINCNRNLSPLSSTILSYDPTNYCELCGEGQVRIIITNPIHENMGNFSIKHVFTSTDLEYVPGSTQFVPVTGLTQTGASLDPVITVSGTTLTWTNAEIGDLLQIDGNNDVSDHTSSNSVEIIFNVRSKSGTEEG